MTIRYAVNQAITSEQFIGLLKETTLGGRRPIDNLERIQGMLDNADLIVTAWAGEKLVGIARSVTDFNFCCYLSDLAVSETVQASGIGKELIRKTFLELKEGCTLYLVAAPQAVNYYPKISMTRHDSAWTLNDVAALK